MLATDLQLLPPMTAANGAKGATPEPSPILSSWAMECLRLNTEYHRAKHQEGNAVKAAAILEELSELSAALYRPGQVRVPRMPRRIEAAVTAGPDDEDDGA